MKIIRIKDTEQRRAADLRPGDIIPEGIITEHDGERAYTTGATVVTFDSPDQMVNVLGRLDDAVLYVVQYAVANAMR